MPGDGKPGPSLAVSYLLPSRSSIKDLINDFLPIANPGSY
jgi:hypothetical protein